MLLVLFTALISDRWINLLLLSTQSSFEGGNFIFFAHPIGHFVVVGVCFFLYWFVIQKSPPDLIISLLFIGTGFLIPFYNIAVSQFSSLDLKTINFLYPFSSSSFLLTAGAFIGLIGFINLFRYRTYSNREKV
jgi:hypothetical protein